MQIAIISDTHMPRGGRRLPDECMARLSDADLILHAGDFVTLPVLTHLESLGELVAVHGNVDEAGLRARLPATAVVEVGGVSIGMIHDAGPSRGRAQRLRKRFPSADAVVFGHSHIPLCERAGDGFQIFNPGSPTERRRAPRHTMGVAHVNRGAVAFELVSFE